MRPSVLPSALLGLLIDWTNTYAHTRTQARTPLHGVYASSDAAFLNDNTLVREGQVQNVLEHEPAQTTSCEHIVSAFSPHSRSSLLGTLLLPFLSCMRLC